MTVTTEVERRLRMNDLIIFRLAMEKLDLMLGSNSAAHGTGKASRQGITPRVVTLPGPSSNEVLYVVSKLKSLPAEASVVAGQD